MELSEREWKLVSLGAFDELRKEVQDRPDVLEFINKGTEHVSDIELFKKRYGYKHDVALDFPPEYLAGFTLDERLETILGLIKKYNAKTVLDIGSRAGYLLFAGMKKCIIKSAVGVELDTSYHNLCQRAKHFFNFPNIDFHNIMFEEFHTEEKFDAIVIADVLEHTIDPLGIIKKTLGMIKETGVLIISVPVDRPPVSPEEKTTMMLWTQQEHVHLLTLEKLKSIATQAGYNHIETMTLSGGWKIDISSFKPSTK